MSGDPILFLVIGRPTENAEKPLILSRLSQELKTWNEHLSGCKLDAELENIIQANAGVKRGCKELVLTSEKLSLVILFDPTVASLKLFSKQFLAVKSCYRQLIYSGPAVAECGSWLLQDGVLQFGDLARMLKDLEMPDFEPFYVNAFDVGKWTQENIEKSTSLCIKLNPEVQQGFSEAGGYEKLLRLVGNLFGEGEDASAPVDLEGKDKFSVSCFGAPNQNCNLVRIGDFKMFVNADATKLPARVYDGSDLIFSMTTDLRSLKWLGSSFDAEKKFHFGMLYSNALSSISQKALLDSAESSEKGLMVSLSGVLKSLMRSLNEANIPVQSCFSSIHLQPTTVYHKAGFGTLRLYPITPSVDNKEAKDLLKSQNNENIISNFPSSSCVLLWQSFNKTSPPIRLFFTGLVPQHSLFEGLIKLKNIQSFSSWEGLSLEESINKLNKLKSKVTQDKAGQVNGNIPKAKDSAKVASKQKANDSSSATSHSAHGDGAVVTTKTQPKSKSAKSEADNVLTKIEKSEKTKNSSISSTPGKSEAMKQPLPKSRLSLGPLVQKASVKPINKDPTSTKPPSALVTASAKPLPTAAKESVKQVQSVKHPIAKAVKDSKPTTKVPPVSKGKTPKSTSTQQKKEPHASEKAKTEVSQKKVKSQKSDEKKDAEKIEEKDSKIEAEIAEIMGTSAITSEVASKEELVSLVSPARDDLINQATPEVAKLDELSDETSEVSAVTSHVDEKSDQLISSKEQENQDDIHAVEEGEGMDMEMPGSELNVEGDARSWASSEKNLIPAVAGALSDDVDEDSLGNEVDKDLHELEQEEDLVVEDTEGGFSDCNISEPSKPIVDEMVRSGISLAESAGTESAPNENLYSQDFGEESPLEEEGDEVCQMEKTLVISKVDKIDELKSGIQSESALQPESDSTEGEIGDVEECIEKDVIEELEKKIEAKETPSCEEKLDDQADEEIVDEHDEGVQLCDAKEPDLLEDEETCMTGSNVLEAQHEEQSENVVEKDQAVLVVDKMSSSLYNDFGEVESNETSLLGKNDEIEMAQMKPSHEELELQLSTASELKEELPVNEFGCKSDSEILKSHDLELEHVEVEIKKEHVEGDAMINDANANSEEVQDFKEQGIEHLDQSKDDKELTLHDESVLEGQKADDIDLAYISENADLDKGINHSIEDLDEESSFRDEQLEAGHDQLIDIGSSEDQGGILAIKKDSGMDDLASICREKNPSSSSENFFSESADSTTAVIGSVSEPRLSGSDEDKLGKGDFGQCCGEIADHLNIIKEHRDAVQKELSSNDVVFYNRNVGFHEGHADELSEEDQDELETISEHPEIEEEEELLMNKDDVREEHAVFPEQDCLADGADGKQLIDFDEYLSKGVAHPFIDPFQCKLAEGTSIGNREDPKEDSLLKREDDLSPVDVAPVHSSSAAEELVAAWGEPMKLPSPEKPKKLNLKKEGALQEVNPASDQGVKKRVSSGTVKPSSTNETSSKNVRATNKVKSATEAKKADPSQKVIPLPHPFYADVAFVHDRDDERHSTYNSDFFKKVRSHYYIINSSCPTILDHLLEGKQTWDSTDVPTVVAINKMDWSKVEAWISSKEESLGKLKVTVVSQINQNILDSDVRLNMF